MFGTLQNRAAFLGLLFAAVCAAQTAPPRVLFVAAHPDDELLAAGTIYRFAQELGGTVDQAIITNGEGGYRYAALAEKFYGLPLTDAASGRRELPDIRKREALAAGKILGVRAHYFFDEPDRNNTDDPDDVLQGGWDVASVLSRLQTLMEREEYSFVIAALPARDAGGHHRAATQLAIRALSRMSAETRPVLLGAYPMSEPYAAITPQTAGFSGGPDYDFDLTRKFGFNNALDYQIVVNWVIAEHKSQGLYQTNVGKFAHEYFWVFNAAEADIQAKASAFFANLAAPAKTPQ